MAREGKDNRSERQSMQIVSEFDVHETQTMNGSANFNCEGGSFVNITGDPHRDGYYCRSIYNMDATTITVVFKFFNDTTSYTAQIATGNWFHSFGRIKTIVGAGTTATTILLAYSKRGKMDGTDNL